MTGIFWWQVLSNHGGRQIDFARSGVEILLEVVTAFKAAGIGRDEVELYIDGGIRRGTDIFKVLGHEGGFVDIHSRADYVCLGGSSFIQFGGFLLC
jgi:hypothetical protein